MAQPITIYLPRVARLSLTEIREHANGATVTPEIDSETEWKSVTVSFGDSQIKLSNDPEQSRANVMEHISGFQGYIWKCAEGKMTAPLFALMQRLYLVHQFIGTVSEPEVTPEIGDFVASITKKNHCLKFIGDTVFGSDFDPIIGPDTGYVDGAEMSYWPDSIERRKENRASLAMIGIKIPETLNLNASIQETILRSPSEVGLRAVVLYYTAYTAVPNGMPKPQVREYLQSLDEWVSPAEKTFLASSDSDQQTTLDMAWRFEALWALLWALNVHDDLGMGNEPHDVAEMDRLIEEFGGAQALIDAKEVRCIEEILEEADMVRCKNWACRDARGEESGPPAGLHPGVVAEQHHALNWLIRFEESEWDDVDTPS
ncbi:MAG: DUF4272 domain-containing protein [Verrucomicrobiota bacterium]